MDWDDLRLFLAAWEHGSLTAAGEALGLSQATLSRRLAALEAGTGQRLFERRRSGLVATAAAVALHPHAVAMAEAARQAGAALQGLEVEPEGVVRLAMAPGVAVELLPLLLTRLAARYPKVRLEVLADHHLVDVDQHEADVALRNAAPTRGDLTWRRLAEVSIGIYAAPSYVAGLGPAPTLADLDWVTYSAELAHLPQAVFVREALAGRAPAFSSNNFLVLRAAAMHGVGCVILPDVQGRAAGLVRLPVELPGAPKGPFFLVVPRALRNVPRVAAVVELVEEVVRLYGDEGTSATR